MTSLQSGSLVIIITLAIAIGIATAAERSDASAAQDDHYAEIGDIRMYYESHGEGLPLIMLNGGLQTAEDYQFLIPHFSPGFRLILIDHRGRGRTNDGNGPLTYNRIAHDVVLLLDHLEINRAHFIGHSEGGAVALELLINFADRVRSATLIGTPLTVTDADKQWFDQQRVAMKTKRFEDVNRAAVNMHETFQRLAPDSSRWSIVIDKMYGGWAAQPTYSDNMLASIKRPVLVIKTDNDQFYAPEVFEQTAKSIPGAKMFAIVEGRHNVPMTHLAQVAGAIRKFITQQSD